MGTQEDSYWPHRLGWLCLFLDRREIQGCPTQDVPLLKIRASKGQAHAHREASHFRGLRSRQGREPHCFQARAPPRQLERLASLHFRIFYLSVGSGSSFFSLSLSLSLCLSLSVSLSLSHSLSLFLSLSLSLSLPLSPCSTTQNLWR